MVRAYRALFLAEFQAAAQYRVQFLLWLIGNVIRPVIFLAAWVAIANARGGSIGASTPAISRPITVALTLGGPAGQASNAFEFEQSIRLGWLCAGFADRLTGSFTVVGDLVWKAVTLPALLRAGADWSGFHAHSRSRPGTSSSFSSVISGRRDPLPDRRILASLAFWTTRWRRSPTSSSSSASLRSQIAPWRSCPAPSRASPTILPFGYMLGVPSDILRGGLTVEQALARFAGQIVWVGLSYVGFQLIWRAGVRQYSAVGA